MLYWLNAKSGILSWPGSVHCFTANTAHLNTLQWPVGGSRLQSIGNIVFGKKKLQLRIMTYCYVRLLVSMIKITNLFSLTLNCYRMGSVNFIVIVESARNLITSDGDLNDFHLPSIIAVGVALCQHSSSILFLFWRMPGYSGVKLMLFLYCFGLRNKSSQVKVLWEDHRNVSHIFSSYGIIATRLPLTL